MKRWIALLCIGCLLMGGCSEKSVEQKLRDFYPEGTITMNEEGFYVVDTPIDVEDYDRVIYCSMSQNYKPITSLKKLQKNYDSSHYILVRGYRSSDVSQIANFEPNGLSNGAEGRFTVTVTEIYHSNGAIPEKITLLEGDVILPHGKERVLYAGRVPLPEEKEEYFFILSYVSRPEGICYSYYNQLAADLKIDEALYEAKDLTDEQKLTLDLMKAYL